jgi:hypothetical protein
MAKPRPSTPRLLRSKEPKVELAGNGAADRSASLKPLGREKSWTATW